MPGRAQTNAGGYHGGGRKKAKVADAAPNTLDARALDALKAIEEWVMGEGTLEEYRIIRLAFVKLTEKYVGHEAAYMARYYTIGTADDKQEFEDWAKSERDRLKRPDPEKVPPEGSLAALMYMHMSKRTLQGICSIANSAAKSKILCSYRKVAEAKLACRPEEISITETKMRIGTASMTQKTLERIALLKKEELRDSLIGFGEVVECELLVTWGMDGCTGHSIYHQEFIDPRRTDHPDDSLVAVTMNPLRLRTNDGMILWENSTPQSPFLVRPLQLEFIKETNKYIKDTMDEFEANFSSMATTPLRIEVPGVETDLLVRVKALPTLVDGKVFNAMTHTGSNVCPDCDAGPKDRMRAANLTNGRFRAKPNRLKYGTQKMHAWIKVLQNILNISYTMPVHQARRRGEQVDKIAAKAMRIAKKEELQKEFDKYGLNVDRASPNGRGNTLTGNLSRRLLRNFNLLSQVTKVNVRLIRRLWVILCCVNNTKYPLDVPKFREYCHETYRLYLKLYPWYTMPPSVHKLLVHSCEEQETLDIPSGNTSEGCAEFRNAFRKRFRRYFTRKFNREATSTDLVNREIDSTDPIVASQFIAWAAPFRRMNKNWVTELPDDALALLKTDYVAPRAPFTRKKVKAVRVKIGKMKRFDSGLTRAKKIQAFIDAHEQESSESTSSSTASVNQVLTATRSRDSDDHNRPGTSSGRVVERVTRRTTRSGEAAPSSSTGKANTTAAAEESDTESSDGESSCSDPEDVDSDEAEGDAYDAEGSGDGSDDDDEDPQYQSETEDGTDHEDAYIDDWDETA